MQEYNLKNDSPNDANNVLVEVFLRPKTEANFTMP
jgi:hypothetical protein